MSYRETFRMNQRDFEDEFKFETIGSNIKAKHESKLYKLITNISEDLRDNKGYSEEEIKLYLIERILEIVSES
jgi:hypothetical protein